MKVRFLFPITFLLCLPGFAQISGTGISGTLVDSRGPVDPAGPAPLLVTYITGEVPGADVIFRVEFDPMIPFSAKFGVAVTELRGFSLDGIDFVPGTGRKEVVVGAPVGIISLYDVKAGFTLPDLIPDTDMTAVPCVPGTWPSSILSTPTHVYYTENQFGFGGTPCHRIIRAPFGGGFEEVVYDGAADGLENFEGLEIVGGRLYFFCEDPGVPGTRALVSISLAGGITDGMPFKLEIPGLFQDPFSTDGSDELDFDPLSGLIFGTNIENGEIIAFDPFLGVEISSPGAVHFIDGATIAASVGDLSLLGAAIDGIRATKTGQLVVSGKGGVLAAIDVFGVLSDGADDGDVIPQIVMPGLIAFDDLTPVF